MRVSLNTDRVGNDFIQRRGDVIVLPAAEANRLIADGHAEPAPKPTRKKPTDESKEA